MAIIPEGVNQNCFSNRAKTYTARFGAPNYFIDNLLSKSEM